MAVLAALILFAACSGDQRGERSGDTGISGLVVAGPQCPVERADSPCPDKPVEVTVVASTPGGEVVAKKESGSDGRFSLEVDPGNYVLTVEGLAGIQFSKPVSVTVVEGSFSPVTIVVDTGSR